MDNPIARCHLCRVDISFSELAYSDEIVFCKYCDKKIDIVKVLRLYGYSEEDHDELVKLWQEEDVNKSAYQKHLENEIRRKIIWKADYDCWQGIDNLRVLNNHKGYYGDPPLP